MQKTNINGRSKGEKYMNVREMTKKAKRAVVSAITAALITTNIAGLFGFTVNAANNGAANFLGNCAKYGIVCNELNQTSHMQTNFATGKFNGNGQYTGADLSNNPGDMMIGELIGDVKLNNGTAGTVIYVDPGVKQIVADMIAAVKAYADSVVAYNSVTLPAVNGSTMNNYVVDVTSLEAGNVYVNLDQIDFTGIADGGMKLQMRDDQTVVFNSTASSFRIPRYSVTVVGSLSNTELAENVIWNIPNATSLNVNSDGMRATVIAPLADTFISTTAEGNLVCNKVTGNNGEWHFISKRVPVPTPTPTPPVTAYGELTITKEVVGVAEGTAWSFDFTVSIDIPEDTEFEAESNAADLFADEMSTVITLTNEAPAMTISGLPEGTTYTVTEVENEDYTSTAVGNTGAISSETAVAAFTNVKNEEPEYGALTVVKSVEGMEEDAAWSFDFNVEVSLPEDTDFAAGSNAADIFADGNNATITLTNENASITIAGLPVGTSYTVSENETEGYIVTSDGANGTISLDGVVANFVNVYTVTPTPTPTETPTPTPTETPTPTPTETPTPTPTNTPEPTPTNTPEPTPTNTPEPTPTNTPEPTPTNTPEPTPTNTPEPTPTNTPEPTPTNTPEPTPTNTPEPTPTNAPEPTPTNAPEPTPTNTPEPTPTNVPEPTPTNTPEPTPTNAPEPTPTNVPEPTPTNAPEPTPTNAPEPTPTNTPEPTPTNAPEPTPTNAPEPTPTNAPEPTPTTTPTPTPTTIVEIPDEDVPLAPGPDNGDVLGVSRLPMDEGEVLGARRAAQTDDNNRSALWTAILLGSTAGIGAWSLFRKKNNRDNVEE